MFNRRYLALPALAAALLGLPVAAFAQSAAPPAGPGAPYATGPSSAQQGPAGQQGRHRHRRRGPVQRALKGLALSPAQRAKIHGFMRAYRTAQTSGRPMTRGQMIAQIEGVLGPQERSRFEARLHHAQRQPAAPGNAPPPPAQ
ncbi:MAG: hypothetical protein IAI50_12845 [Candidatus Eremiobacteraeota bacterium]|nr:hypothetical protein [Candidatus Eremiobacteraeota bacterium]